MKIAFVTTSYPRDDGDPAGHFVRAEVRACVAAGHEVVVLSPPSTEAGAFGWPGVAARVRARPWTALEAARWIVRARSELARSAIDRAVCHWVVPSVVPIAGATAAPIEAVSHGGDVRALCRLPAPLRHALTEHIASRVVTWRFVSAALLDDLRAALSPRVASRVTRVATVRPSPIDIPSVDETRANAQQKRTVTRAPLFVSVGRLVPGKRVERAIDHVSAVAPDARLVIVGDGPARARLEAHARARGVDARFVGLVPRSEALAWIAAADALLHASEAEGLSTVVREAELLGVPVTDLSKHA